MREDETRRTRVVWLFTDRYGGKSNPPYEGFNLGDHVGDDPNAVASNRCELGMRLAGRGVVGPIVWMNQTHSNRVAVVDASSAAGSVDADGIVTADVGVALAVVTADCLPLLVIDDDNGVIGAIHVGREGYRQRIVEHAVEAMTSCGAVPATIRAIIGPVIGPRCYELDAKTLEPLTAMEETVVHATDGGGVSLDLGASVKNQLARLGIVTVARVGGCTHCDPRYFSYRRCHVTGRQAGIVAMADLSPRGAVRR